MTLKAFWVKVAVTWCFVWAIFTIWALADPLMSRPDEVAQIYRTESIVRGQLLGVPVNPATDPQNQYFLTKYPKLANAFEQGDPNVWVKVPATLKDISKTAYCYFLKKQTTPKCNLNFKNRKGLITVETYVGRYPPFYYYLVGWITLISPGKAGLIGTRILSGLINSFFVAISLSLTLQRKTIYPLAGVVVALTPVVFYYGASLNPNGLEISSALSSWVALIYIANVYPKQKNITLPIYLAGLSLTTLSLSRASSPLWYLFIVVLFCLYIGVVKLRELIALKSVKLAFLTSFIAATITTLWDWLAHGFDELHIPFPPSVGESEILTQALNLLLKVLNEMIAVFGLNDIFIPEFLIILWGAIIYTGLIVVLLAVKTNKKIVLAILGLGPFVLPMMVALLTARSYGLIWQGRYSLPPLIGLPVLIGFELENLEVNLKITTQRLLKSITIGSLFIVSLTQLVSIWLDESFYLVGHGSKIKVLTMKSPLGLPGSIEIFILVILAIWILCNYYFHQYVIPLNKEDEY
jgi:hypothetical protein